jgi:hypothetical protein
MPRYRIEAAMFKLAIPFLDRIVHNFWILREIDSNTIMSQLHGYATSRKTGAILAVGYTRDHSLRAYCNVDDKDFAMQHGWQSGAYPLRVDDSHPVYEGDDCIQRWQLAVDAIALINTLDLDYPSFGFKFPLSTTINSNSIYHTFAQIMSLPLHKFAGFIQVGIIGSIYDKIKVL